MGRRIVILGAGFGGLAAAVSLRKGLDPEHSIVVVDKKRFFMMGLVNLWILAGTRRLEDSQTSLQNLDSKGIEYLNDEVVRIDADSSLVQTASHGTLSYDFLIISLGSELAPENVPGFLDRGYNLYDAAQMPRLRERLLSLEKGRVAVVIMGMPYKCPPAPFEASMIIDWILQENGSRQNTSIDVYSPAPIALPVAGAKISSMLTEMLQSRGIYFHPMHKLNSVSETEMTFLDEPAKDFDVLVGVPPHKVPEVILRSNLAGPNGWIEVDKHTLRTSCQNIFAIGDVTEIKVTPNVSVPKAGIFAEAQAKVVAQEIIDAIACRDSGSKFDGRGFCFMENGGTVAGMVEANFYNDGGPDVKLESPSAENYEKKQEFERARLAEWLL